MATAVRLRNLAVNYWENMIIIEVGLFDHYAPLEYKEVL